jgi:predicted nucleic-acid-binding Zn-ribbon protein
MNASCSKCGSNEVLTDIPVVACVDNSFSAFVVSALAFNKPDARVFKGPVTHRFLARVCGSCGFAEFYVEDPKSFMAVVKRADVDA